MSPITNAPDSGISDTEFKCFIEHIRSCKFQILSINYLQGTDNFKLRHFLSLSSRKINVTCYILRSIKKILKMSKLSDYSLLSFDVYGTLIDWEGGILTALKPLTDQKDLKREQILEIYHDLEKEQQSKTPDMRYSELCTTIYPKFAERIDLPAPSIQGAEAFGQSVGEWPAFEDTVDALKRLSKHYKLVVLSNVDKESFKSSNAGPLQGFPFDRIITAQEVGSYKPDQRNFEYMLKTVKEEFGVERSQVLQTAQSQFHDHHPAKKMGITSVWISRSGTMGNREEEVYQWKFATLDAMADALEKELAPHEHVNS
jgi:2-haloalkanoic acid dehalogenase type II